MAKPILLLLLYGTYLSSSTLLPLPGQVGGPCLPGRSPCILANSECIDGTCLCTNFYRYFNGSCVTEESTTLGRSCRGGAECRGQGEFCSSFAICMCLSTHVEIGNQCKPAVYPGQFGCEDSRQCSKGFPGAECDISRTCVCPLGMVHHQQTCVMPSALSNLILSDEQLLPLKNRYSLTNFYRRRAPVSHNSVGHGLAPDSLCSTDSDCAGYPFSFCDGICRCVHGAVNAGTTCVGRNHALQPAAACPPGQTYITEAGACMTIQQPGHPCQYSQQCASIEPGAFCLRLRCECVYGMKQSGTGCTFVNNECTQRGHIWISELGECKEVIPPGGYGCSHSLQCTAAYPEATCFMQTCTCPPTFPIAIDGTCGRNCSQGETYSGVTGQCLPTVAPGGQCVYSSQCQAFFGGMQCDRNVCRCAGGLVFTGSKCERKCPQGYMANSRGICVHACRPNQVEYDGECLEEALPGQSCVVNVQCKGGSICEREQCRCLNNMIPRNGECVHIEIAPVMPTTPQTLAAKNRVCPSGMVLINGECRPAGIAHPGSRCSNGELCTGGSVCMDEICTCPLGYALSSAGTCVPTAPPGSPCTLETLCSGGSACVDALCLCPIGSIAYRGECHSSTHSLGFCHDPTLHCPPTSVCDHVLGVCVCPNGLVNVGSRCVDTETLNSPTIIEPPPVDCYFDSECPPPRACIMKRCICLFGEHPDGTCIVNSKINKVQIRFSEQKANVMVEIGDACVRVGVRCGGSASCVAGVCICPLGTTPWQGECITHTTAKPGESCARGEDCLERSYCNKETKRCECESDTQMVVGEKCVERLRSHVGYPCNNNEICVGGSVCDDTKCVCPLHKREVDKQCVDRVVVRPGESCSKGEECGGRSKCDITHKICTCSRGEENIAGECVAVSIVPPGERCNRAMSRCGGGSYCLRGRCECPQNMRPLDKKCVQQRQILPGQKCTSSDNCMGKSICYNSICKCPEGTVLRGTVCSFRRKVEAGGACEADDTCMGGSECTEGFCHCRPGEVIRNGICAARKTARPGFICEPDDICTGQSICINSRCQCEIGFRVSGGKCVAAITIKVAIGESCSETKDCIDGICMDGRCLCVKGTIPKGNSCVVAEAAPGMACSNGEKCLGNSYCDGRICTCRDDQRLEAGACVNIPPPPSEKQVLTLRPPPTTPAPPQPIGPSIVPTVSRPQPTAPVTRCRTNGDCPRSSICNRGYCSCPPGSQMRNGVCSSVAGPKKPGLLGHACQFAEDCKVPNSVCVNGSCECKAGYRIFGSTQCIIRADFTASPAPPPAPHPIAPPPPTLPTIFLVLPGEVCDRMKICQRGSTCIDGKCSCAGELVFIRGNCIRKRPINVRPLASCTAGEICPENSECLYGVCLCSANFTLFRGNCKDPEEIREILQKEMESLMTRRPKPHLPYTLPFVIVTSTRQSPTTSPAPNPLIPILPPTSVISTSTEETSSLWFKLAKPGYPCDRTVQCTNCSICSSGYCQCPQGLDLVGDACVSPADAHNCVASNQCPSGAECIRGQCRCLAGLAPSRFGFCIPINYADPGKSCAFGEECRGNSECHEGICVCKEGLYLIDNTCQPPISALKSKRVKRFIKSSPSDQIFTNKMQAAEVTMINWNGVGAGEKCSGTVTCVENAACVNGVCRCNSNFVQTGQTCILRSRIVGQIAGVGAFCAQNTFCDGGSSCVRQVCTCPATHRNQNGICVRILAQPSESCANGERCTGGSICLNSVCSCPSHTNLINGTCIPFSANNIARSPGLNCQNNPGVCTGGSYCLNGVCVCAIGFTPVNGQCISSGTNPTVSPPLGSAIYARPGESCANGQVCTGNSICANSFCVCPGGEQIRDGVCISVDSQADPGEMCQQGITTCTGNSICQQNVCRCLSNQVALNGQCARVIGQGTLACMPPCGANSYCNPTYGQCQCNTGFSMYNGMCSPVARDNLCNPQCGQYSQCVEGQCICNQGYSYSNGYCNPSTSCNPPCPQYSSCNPGGYCTCNQGYYNSNGNCYPNTLPQQQSIGCNNNQCGQYSYCQNNQCNCISGYSYSNGQCTPTTNCNPPCGSYSQCEQGQCQCINGYQMQNTGQCTPVLANNNLYNYNCNPPCGSNANCQQNGCVCNTGYSYSNNGQCTPVNNNCNPQCGQNSYCMQGSCYCNPGYSYSSGSCMPSSSLLQQPLTNCNPGCGQNSYCYQGSCQCNPGYQFTNSQCLPVQSQPNCDPPCGMYASCQQGSCYCNQGYSLSPNGQCQPSCSPNLCQPNCNPQNINCQQPALSDASSSPFFGLPGQQCDLRPGALMCRNMALCVNNRCTCPSNLVQANSQCVQFAGNAYPGQSCQTPGTICRGGSSCATNNICVCEPNFSVFNGECVPSSLPTPPPYNGFQLRPGQACDPRCQDEPCLQSCGGGSTCINGICTCPIGAVDMRGNCIFPSADGSMSCNGGAQAGCARPGEQCDVTVKCTGGSSCLIGTCTCEQGYVPSYDRSSCVLQSSLPRIAFHSYVDNNECSKDSECYSSNALCVNKKCTCRKGLHDFEGQCVPYRLAYPGSICNTTCTLGSVCRKNYCICPAGTSTNSTGHCVSYSQTDTNAALPGAECILPNTICEAGSVCTDKYCICQSPSINTGNGICGGHKFKKYQADHQYSPRLGDGCSLQSDCRIGNATCMNFRCECIEGFERIDNRCEERIIKAKTCRSFRDCDSPRVCDSSGICKCPFTMIDSNGVCLYRNNTVPPGSYCDSEVKCQESSQCIAHVCVLTTNNNNNNPPVLIGRACSNNDICANGAICRNSVCICEHGINIDGITCKGVTRHKREQQRRIPSSRSTTGNLTTCPTDGSCTLPGCFCSRSGMEIPGGLERKETPQMIVLTFTGPITDRVINIYKSLFDGKLRNPNGCAIGGTFFISHQFNNYDQTQWVHSRGGEIAVNSITYEILRDKSSERWRHEMAGMRDSLRAFSYVDKENIRGIRAPHLVLGGDEQFDMMEAQEFSYDNSMAVSGGPYWPQTLDHTISWDCGEQRCPKKPHKGIWEIPIQMLQGNDGMWKESAIKTIKPYDTKASVKQFLQRNFYRNYKSNRAPFVLNMDTEWLNYAPDNQVAEALEEWLQDVLNKTDVYVVTNNQLISWMKTPKRLDEIRQFRDWQCNYLLNDHVHPCENPSVCSYAPSGGLRSAHSFRVCGSCPKAYPWIEDPLGNRQLSRH